jgi:hypothetical protein
MHVSHSLKHHFGLQCIQRRQAIESKKHLAIVHMFTWKTPKDIQVFNGMAKYYRCFIKDFAFIMAPIAKLL